MWPWWAAPASGSQGHIAYGGGWLRRSCSGQRACRAALTMTPAPASVNLPLSRTRCTIASEVCPPFLTASQVRPAQL